MQYYARFDGNAIELEKVKTILKEQIKSLSLSKTLKIRYAYVEKLFITKKL